MLLFVFVHNVSFIILLSFSFLLCDMLHYSMVHCHVFWCVLFMMIICIIQNTHVCVLMEEPVLLGGTVGWAAVMARGDGGTLVRWDLGSSLASSLRDGARCWRARRRAAPPALRGCHVGSPSGRKVR